MQKMIKFNVGVFLFYCWAGFRRDKVDPRLYHRGGGEPAGRRPRQPTLGQVSVRNVLVVFKYV